MFETLHKACAMSLGGSTGIAPEGIDTGMPAFAIPAGSTEPAAANHLRKESARGHTAIIVASATRQGTRTPRRRTYSWSSCSYSAMTCAPSNNSVAMISMLNSATTAVVREP